MHARNGNTVYALNATLFTPKPCTGISIGPPPHNRSTHLAYHHIRRVPHEEHHARRVRRGELRDEPRHGVQLQLLGVVREERRAREDHRVVPHHDAHQREQRVEVREHAPAARAAAVAHGVRGGLEHARGVERDRHVREGEEEEEDVVRLDAVGADDARADRRGAEALGGPEEGDGEDRGGGEVQGEVPAGVRGAAAREGEGDADGDDDEEDGEDEEDQGHYGVPRDHRG